MVELLDSRYILSCKLSRQMESRLLRWAASVKMLGVSCMKTYSDECTSSKTFEVVRLHSCRSGILW